MLAGGLCVPAWARGPVVEVLSSDSGGVYAELGRVLQRDTAALPVSLALAVRVGAVAPAVMPSLVVALGTQALREAAQRATQSPAWAAVPVLAALVPQAAHRGLAVGLPKGSSAVWLDQPVDRFLVLLRQAMPQRRRVGVLLGPTSSAQEPLLARAAAQRELELVVARVANVATDLYPALQVLLHSADVLLALPDPLLYNTEALQNILIASYRQRVPLLSYSAAHVRAGATLALHTPIDQVSLQVAQALRAFADGRGLPPAELAQGFAVAINEQVARSLSLDFGSSSELEAAVRRLEKRP